MGMDIDQLRTGRLEVTGPICLGRQDNGSLQVTALDANLQASDNAVVVQFGAITANRQVTLPVNPKPGQVVLIKNGSGAFNLTALPPGTVNLDGVNGAKTIATGAYGYGRVFFDGTAWWTC